LSFSDLFALIIDSTGIPTVLNPDSHEVVKVLQACLRNIWKCSDTDINGLSQTADPRICGSNSDWLKEVTWQP